MSASTQEKKPLKPAELVVIYDPEETSDTNSTQNTLIINIDPTDKTVAQNYIWTGTNEDGPTAQPFRTCNGWNPYTNARGVIGSTGHTLATWSSQSQNRCNTNRHRLACFQQ